MENIKTEIHGEMDCTKVSTNTMVHATGVGECWSVPPAPFVSHRDDHSSTNAEGCEGISIPSSNRSVAGLPLKSKRVEALTGESNPCRIITLAPNGDSLSGTPAWTSPICTPFLSRGTLASRS